MSLRAEPNAECPEDGSLIALTQLIAIFCKLSVKTNVLQATLHCPVLKRKAIRAHTHRRGATKLSSLYTLTLDAGE